MRQGGSYGSWGFAFKDPGVIQRSCNNSQILSTPQPFLHSPLLCSLSMITPMNPPPEGALSAIMIPLLAFLVVLAILVIIPALVAWWLGLKSLMTFATPPTLPIVMPLRMTDSGCCPMQELGQGRVKQVEGVLGIPKSSGIFSTWANWIGQHTTNLFHTLSDLLGTLQLQGKNCWLGLKRQKIG